MNTSGTDVIVPSIPRKHKMMTNVDLTLGQRLRRWPRVKSRVCHLAMVVEGDDDSCSARVVWLSEQITNAKC